MTNEEARKSLLAHGMAMYYSECPEDEIEDRDEILSALSKGVEALEKQIPKKPIAVKIWYNNIEPSYIYYCPSCDYRLTTRIISLNGEKVIVHCECCGQAFDWSDENGND